MKFLTAGVYKNFDILRELFKKRFDQIKLSLSEIKWYVSIVPIIIVLLINYDKCPDFPWKQRIFLFQF